jgi:hypothetical protein
MADQPYDTRRLLVLRKTTRALADFLRTQVKDHLATIAPLLRPKAVLGDYAGAPTKEKVPGADKAFKELQSAYEAVAVSKPFGLPRELNAPLAMLSTTPELTPLEYSHTAQAGAEHKTVTVSSPFQWVLSYAGFTPSRIRQLLSARRPTGDDLQQCVLHALMLHAAISRQPGLVRLLEALRCPARIIRLPDLGELPFVCLSSPVPTLRPPDDVVIESTELSGMSAFEEVVNVEAVLALRDPLREQLIDLIRGQGAELLPPEADGPAPAGTGQQ